MDGRLTFEDSTSCDFLMLSINRMISAEMMFRTGSQLVFHMQLARNRDAVPITRDYITDAQRVYAERETESLAF